MKDISSCVQTHSLWQELGITDQGLIAGLAILFCGFEDALKRGGYLREDKTGPWPDWWRFADCNCQVFDGQTDDALHQATECLIANPARLQIRTEDAVVDYQANPSPLPGDGIPQKAVNAIQRVRNNLFHGGKFGSGEIEDPARSECLLRHSVTVLEHAAELDERLKRVF